MNTQRFIEFIKELRKRDKMLGLPSILFLFRNKFNKFNNTGARMLDSKYHMTLEILKNRIFGVKMSKLSHLFTQRYNERHYISRK